MSPQSSHLPMMRHFWTDRTLFRTEDVDDWDFEQYRGAERDWESTFPSETDLNRMREVGALELVGRIAEVDAMVERNQPQPAAG